MGLSVPVSVEPAGILSQRGRWVFVPGHWQGDLPLSPSSAVLKAKLGHQRSGNSDLIFRGRSLPLRSEARSSSILTRIVVPPFATVRARARHARLQPEVPSAGPLCRPSGLPGTFPSWLTVAVARCLELEALGQWPTGPHVAVAPGGPALFSSCR